MRTTLVLIATDLTHADRMSPQPDDPSTGHLFGEKQWGRYFSGVVLIMKKYLIEEEPAADAHHIIIWRSRRLITLRAFVVGLRPSLHPHKGQQTSMISAHWRSP
jgi:hypothetical protein